MMCIHRTAIAWASIRRGLGATFGGVALLATTSHPVLAQSLEIGVIAGELAVEQTGAAGYRVPLTVPPGTSGMQPELAVGYSSGAGNGLLGVGWSIDGLSNITRCKATLAQDGFNGGINFDAEDRFCLDGARLVEIYTGASEYRTEIDGFSRTTRLGGTAANPDSFVVETKSGLRMEYGAATGSRVTLSGGHLLWALNKISDTYGNYLTVNYGSNGLGIYPAGIDYTGNANTSLQPGLHVDFVYETRTDGSENFVKGELLTNDRLMKSVVMRVGTQEVRRYDFAHELSGLNQRNRLVSVTECAKDGTVDVCKPATTFAYNDGVLGFAYTANPVPQGPLGSNRYPQFEVADFNGDGYSDILFVGPAGQVTYSGYSKLYLNNKNGGFTEYNSPIAAADLDSEGSYGLLYSQRSRLTVGDFNCDGRSDAFAYWPLMSWDDGVNYGDYTRFFISNGSGGFTTYTNSLPYNRYTSSAQPLVADYNGDGCGDLYIVDNQGSNRLHLVNPGTLTFSQSVNPIQTGAINNSSNLFPADFDGDGMADLFYHAGSNGTTKLFLANGSGGFTALPVGSTAIPAGNVDDYPQNTRVGDFNSDGLPDLVFHWGSGGNLAGKNRFYINKGDGSFEERLDPIGPDRIDESPQAFEVGDFNSDGLPDIFTYWSDGRNRIYLNDGHVGFTEMDGKIPAAQINVSGYKVQIGDFNGDAVGDLLLYNSSDCCTSGAQRLFLGNYEGAQKPYPDLLANVTDGLGKGSDITYSTLADPGVYSSSGTGYSANPVVRAAIPVVASVESDSSDSGRRTLGYRYSNLRVNLQGRGLLGFESMTVEDLLENSRTTTNYEQIFPKTGSVSNSRREVLYNGYYQEVSSTGAYLGISYPVAGNTSIVALEAISSSESTTDPDTSAHVNSSTSTEYDDYGNPTRITVNTMSYGGGAPYQHFTTETVNTYTNDIANWHLGRLTRSEVTKTLPDYTSATRVSAFTYNARGVLDSETVEPDLPGFATTTTYLYDLYGNKIRTTVSGATTATKETEVVYDGEGRFPTTQVNSLDHEVQVVHDQATGLLLAQTVDINQAYTPGGGSAPANNRVTSYEYDAFGRQVMEFRSDGTWIETAYLDPSAATPDPDFPANGAYGVSRAHRAVEGGSTINVAPPAKEFFDKFARSVRKVGIGLNGETIYSDTQFDDLGRVVYQSGNYFAGYSPTGTVRYEYDALGRVTCEHRNGTSCASSTIKITRSYAGLATTTTDAIGHSTTEVKDAIGQLTKVIDAYNNETLYEYNHFGNLAKTTDAAGNVTTITYDILGRKVAMSDPDTGARQYEYDVDGTGLANITSQRDANGNVTETFTDTLGRIVRREIWNEQIMFPFVSVWTYDNGLDALGKLVNASKELVGATLTEETREYDQDGLPLRKTFDNGAQVMTYSYHHEHGRLVRTTYPGISFAVTRRYNEYGYLNQLSDINDSFVYWTAVSANADGKLTEENLGNGLTTLRSYDPDLGAITQITTGNNGSVQALTFQYDDVGNLVQRVDGDTEHGYTEAFQYDDLNRLIANAYTGLASYTTTYTYDALGNITYKSDVGSYSYGANGAGPHAVTAAGTATYTYDAVGNQLSGDGRTLDYTWGNKLTSISKNGETTAIWYDHDERRYIQLKTAANGDETTTYYGDLYEKEVGVNNTTERLYISAGGAPLAVQINRSNGANEFNYLHRDHLGSLHVITDAQGAEKQGERFSYSPFGESRALDTGGILAGFPSNTLLRGFTGHEHLNGFGLIHMNGRVYDPKLGRFLSADPFVQTRLNPQALNRYSYVLNNPLSYTDPSGYFFKKLFKGLKKFLKKYGRMILAVAFAYVAWGAVMMYMNPCAITIAGAAGMAGPSAFIAAGAAGGFVGGFIASGGNLKSAIIGGISGAAMGYIGTSSAFGRTAVTAERVIAHGVVGGVSSEAQGGKFATGFMSSAFSKSLAGKVEGNFKGNSVGGAAASAVIGGTASRIAGGKFANGAVTSAFAYLFNQAATSQRNAAATMVGIPIGKGHLRQVMTKLGYSEAEIDKEVAGFDDVKSDVVKVVASEMQRNAEIGGNALVRALNGAVSVIAYVTGVPRANIPIPPSWDGEVTDMELLQAFNNNFTWTPPYILGTLRASYNAGLTSQ